MENKELIDAVIGDIPDVVAIYLSGSRLNKLNVRPTDYDLFVITTPTITSIITGQHYVGQHHVTLSNTYADAKIYDTLKLTEVYIKSNPNTTELFYRKPIYTSPEFESTADWLGSEDMLRYALAVGHMRFVHAVFGQIKQEGKSFQNGNVGLTRQTKIVVTTSKFARYLSEYLHDGILSSVETPTSRELELREKSAVLSELEGLLLEGDHAIDSEDLKQRTDSFREELLSEFNKITAHVTELNDMVASGKIIVPKAELDYSIFKRMLML